MLLVVSDSSGVVVLEFRHLGLGFEILVWSGSLVVHWGGIRRAIELNEHDSLSVGVFV